jgi:hypothetical protein
MKKLLTILLLTTVVIPLAAVDEERLFTVYESEIRPFIEMHTTVGQLLQAD